VRLLTTSREVLGVRGEHVIALSSLRADDAVALFGERARVARPDVDLDDDELAAAEEVCVRLDGIPLASGVAAEASVAGQRPECFAAEGGEDYELLVALPPGLDVPILPVRLTQVGRLVDGNGLRATLAGAPVDLKGFQHFR
jgi:hypothetical protein